MLLLSRATAAMTPCLRHEPLYWLVFNGTRLCYKLAVAMMRPVRAVPCLAWPRPACCATASSTSTAGGDARGAVARAQRKAGSAPAGAIT